MTAQLQNNATESEMNELYLQKILPDYVWFSFKELTDDCYSLRRKMEKRQSDMRAVFVLCCLYPQAGPFTVSVMMPSLLLLLILII